MVEWQLSADPVDYPAAVAAMEARVAAIREGRAPESDLDLVASIVRKVLS